VAIVKSDDHVACRFYHTLTHSVVGWSCVIHLYRGLLPALDIEHKVSYTLCLNALGVSLCLGEVGGGSFQGHISAGISESSVSSRHGGVSLYVCSFQYCCNSADADPSCWPWVHIRVSRSARNFSSTTIRPHPRPSSFSAGWRCVP